MLEPANTGKTNSIIDGATLDCIMERYENNINLASNLKLLP